MHIELLIFLVQLETDRKMFGKMFATAPFSTSMIGTVIMVIRKLSVSFSINVIVLLGLRHLIQL